MQPTPRWSPKAENVLDPGWLDQTAVATDAIVAAMARQNVELPLWNSETSSFWGGGTFLQTHGIPFALTLA